MKDALDDELGFAAWSQQPIRYIDRTHAWYDALGYGNPYRYAQYAQVPFTPLRKPLAESRVALLTTAAPYQPDKGDQGPNSPYNAAAKFYEVYSGDTAIDHDLRISHVGVHRSFMSDDSGCWFPLPALRRAAAAGRGFDHAVDGGGVARGKADQTLRREVDQAQIHPHGTAHRPALRRYLARRGCGRALVHERGGEWWAGSSINAD